MYCKVLKFGFQLLEVSNVLLSSQSSVGLSNSLKAVLIICTSSNNNVQFISSDKLKNFGTILTKF